MIIAQITDAHMTVAGRRPFGDYDPGPALARTLAAIAGLRPRPDIVLFTGDLAESGLPAEYAAVRAALAGFDLPVAAIPGNHDRREAFGAAFAGGAAGAGPGGFLHFTVEDRPLRLIGLDTLAAPGASQGLLCDARLDWVAARLAESARPTLIFMHHPPFATGIGFMDAIGCVGGDRLGEIVARHPCVLRVACGHAHRPVFAAFGGTIASICPAVAYETALRLAPGAPAAMQRRSPGYQLHVWSPALGLVTHTDYVGEGA